MSKSRLESIDATRGLMMVLMALDHTRDYFSNVPFDANDELKTNFLLFFTRWITNLCAPTFVLLVGVSMYLALKSGKTKRELSWLLVTRGLWLIIADFFIIHVAWTFTFNFSLIEFDVLSVTGLGMIMLAALIFIPRWAIVVLGIVVLAGHNLLDGHDVQFLGAMSWLHLPNPFSIMVLRQQIEVYPWYVAIPWIIVPGLGYLFGNIFDLTAAKRARLLIIFGIACLVLFFIIRTINLYGDPHPWINYPDKIRTIFSFLNVTKYPPSILYFLPNFGLACFILLFFEKYKNKFTEILAKFGKVPFAFYVLHIFVIHAIAFAVAYLRYGSLASGFVDNKFLIFDPATLAPYGYNLLIVYAIWIAILIIFYPFCKWYGAFKEKYKAITLLSYL